MDGIKGPRKIQSVSITQSTTHNDMWCNALAMHSRVPVDLRGVIYCTAIRQGGDREWKFLWSRYGKSNVASERQTILGSLGWDSHEILESMQNILRFHYLSADALAKSGYCKDTSTGLWTKRQVCANRIAASSSVTSLTTIMASCWPSHSCSTKSSKSIKSTVSFCLLWHANTTRINLFDFLPISILQLVTGSIENWALPTRSCWPNGLQKRVQWIWKFPTN